MRLEQDFSDVMNKMWPIVVIFLGFVAGLGTGYKFTHKKVVPLVRFVAITEKEGVLKKHGIHLDKTTKCSICGNDITIENIGAVITTDGGHEFLCSKRQCMTVGNILRPVSRISKE